MRVVQLDIDGHRIQFHPYVTVVRGLAPGARASMVAALAGLPAGESPAPGLVEVHGVLLNLSVETMALLDLDPPLVDGLDVILRADQLPRALRPEALSRNELDRRREKIAAQLARYEAEAERGRRASGEELEERTRRRAELETRVQAADAARTDARQALHEQQERRAHARQLRAEATRALEEAWEALDVALSERDPLVVVSNTDRHESHPSDARNGDGSDTSVRIDELQRRRGDLETSLLALATVDPFLVERALEQLASGDDVEVLASADAQRVADEWVENENAISGVDAVEIVSGDVLAGARLRLEAARAALLEAELAARVRAVDRLDREALDQAHEAVVAAQDRANKRVGGRRARENLAEIQAKEQAILDRLGFDTYASFTISRSVEQADTADEHEHRLARLRDELFAAEDALPALEEGIDAELDHAALLGRRHALRDEATLILGRDPGDDLEWVLRQHRIEEVIDRDNVARLRAVLLSAGLVLPDPLPENMLVDLAEIWLGEQREASHRREDLRRELGEVQAALRSAGAMAEDEPLLERQRQVEAEVSERRSSFAEALDAERSAVAEVLAAEESMAEAARTEHDASAERARLGAELAAAVAAEREMADAHDEPQETEAVAARAEAAAATARGELAATDRLLERLTSEGDDGPAVMSTVSVQDLEWYLLSRVATGRTSSYAGSLPFVIDDAIRGLRGEALQHLLGCLEAASNAVQIVIVSDDNEISNWTQDVGADRAVTHALGSRPGP
jgi:hypothetical protein